MGPVCVVTGGKGCRVVEAAAEKWNDLSRGWWRELNRVCKLRADRAVKKLGADYKGGLLLYQWELQSRGVWHLHFVVGLETAIERAWAIEYVKAMRELGPSKGFGFVDAKPLRSPRPAADCAGYISKYLAKRRADGTFEVSETVKAAGRTLLNYVSRRLTAKSGVHDAGAAETCGSRGRGELATCRLRCSVRSSCCTLSACSSASAGSPGTVSRTRRRRIRRQVDRAARPADGPEESAVDRPVKEMGFSRIALGQGARLGQCSGMTPERAWTEALVPRGVNLESRLLRREGARTSSIFGAA